MSIKETDLEYVFEPLEDKLAILVINQWIEIAKKYGHAYKLDYQIIQGERKPVATPVDESARFDAKVHNFGSATLQIKADFWVKKALLELHLHFSQREMKIAMDRAGLTKKIEREINKSAKDRKFEFTGESKGKKKWKIRRGAKK